MLGTICLLALLLNMDPAISGHSNSVDRCDETTASRLEALEAAVINLTDINVRLEASMTSLRRSNIDLKSKFKAATEENTNFMQKIENYQRLLVEIYQKLADQTEESTYQPRTPTQPPVGKLSTWYMTTQRTNAATTAPWATLPGGEGMKAFKVGQVESCSIASTKGLTQIDNYIIYPCDYSAENGTIITTLQATTLNFGSSGKTIVMDLPFQLGIYTGGIAACQKTNTLYAVEGQDFAERSLRIWSYKFSPEVESTWMVFARLYANDSLSYSGSYLSITSSCDLLVTWLGRLFRINSTTGEIDSAIFVSDRKVLESVGSDSFVILDLPPREIDQYGTELRRYAPVGDDISFSTNIEDGVRVIPYGYFIASVQYKSVSLLTKDLKRNVAVEGLEDVNFSNMDPKSIYYNELSKQLFVRAIDTVIKVYNITKDF